MIQSEVQYVYVYQVREREGKGGGGRREGGLIQSAEVQYVYVYQDKKGKGEECSMYICLFITYVREYNYVDKYSSVCVLKSLLSSSNRCFMIILNRFH